MLRIQGVLRRQVVRTRCEDYNKIIILLILAYIE